MDKQAAKTGKELERRVAGTYRAIGATAQLFFITSGR